VQMVQIGSRTELMTTNWDAQKFW